LRDDLRFLNYAPIVIISAKSDKGSPTVGKGAAVGRVTTTQLREIAEQKMKDMNANDVDAAIRMLAGSAKSMGLTVVEG